VSAQKAKHLSHWSRYQFLIPSFQGLLSNPDKLRRQEREKQSFLKTPISRTCFPVRHEKSNQPEDVVFAFRIISNCNRSDFWTPKVHSSSNTVLRH
jgi:hypothetical protein